MTIISLIFLIFLFFHFLFYLPIQNDIKSFFHTLSKFKRDYFSTYNRIALESQYQSLYQKCCSFRFFHIYILHFCRIYRNLSKIQNQYNKKYIQSGLKIYKVFFDHINGYALDEQQRRAVLTDEDNTLIVAGAGSGKTLTILGKIRFLVEVKKIPANEILCISFTKEATNNMAQKIQKDANYQIQSCTFHSLGYKILKQSGFHHLEITDSKTLESCVHQYLTEEIFNHEEILDYYLYFLSFYLYVPTDLEACKSLQEVFELERGYDFSSFASKIYGYKESLSNLGELILANFLFLHQVDYSYQSLYQHGVFYLKDYSICILYLEITEEGDMPWLSHFEAIRKKKGFEKVYQEILKSQSVVVFYSYQLEKGDFLETIFTTLKKMGVAFKKRQFRILYQQILHSSSTRIFWGFEKLCSTFIQLFKANYGKGDDFDTFLKEDFCHSFLKVRNQYFLFLIREIYFFYQDFLTKNRQIDFHDMVNLAIDSIQHNHFHEKYRYIIIDEYQDTSYTRYLLVRALKEKCGAKIVAVGDDFQSIFRFTGCDLDIFLHFEEYFGSSEILKIENTYRNSQELIDVAGNFVMKNPKQLTKNLHSCKRQTKPIKVVYYHDDMKGEFYSLLRTLYQKGIRKLFILSRNYRDILELIDDTHLCKTEEDDLLFDNLDDFSIRYMTVHKSKGLEEENVLLIHLENSMLGFPNKMADDLLLHFVLKGKDEFLYEEERRLFYVALTRTKQDIYLFVPKENPSCFVTELLNYSQHVEVLGDVSGPERIFCPACHDGSLILRKGQKEFVGCSNYPKCRFTLQDSFVLKHPILCPKCGGYLVPRHGNHNDFLGCIYYPECNYTKEMPKY